MQIYRKQSKNTDLRKSFYPFVSKFHENILPSSTFCESKNFMNEIQLRGGQFLPQGEISVLKQKIRVRMVKHNTYGKRDFKITHYGENDSI